MKYVIKEGQLNLLFESDSFNQFMKRRYSELEEDLNNELSNNRYVCDIRLNMYKNYICGQVADLYLNRNHKDWFSLYEFLKKVFSDKIEKDYFDKSRNCK